MKKPVKVLTSTALLAALATSTITPTAVQAQENLEQYKIQDVIFVSNGKLVKLPFEEYTTEVGFGTINDTVQYIMYPNGKMFSLEDYSTEASFVDFNPKETYEELVKSAEEKIGEVVEGEITPDGKVVAKGDEQPEDRLNETLVYNFAA